MPTLKTQQSLVTALQSASNRLEYLTQNDWLLLADKAEAVEFKKGEKLFKEGEQNKAIYLVMKGEVAIHASSKARIAKIGPGEICGEMAYLEGTTASATPVAGDAVEALTISWDKLDELFMLYPHLASRFYRSLAISLSRRLRQRNRS